MLGNLINFIKNASIVRRFPEEIAVLDIEAIQKIIPHRYPFLLIDTIIDFEPGKRATGSKNVTINEYFFTGHFPDHPVMPGVLIVEALAQVGAVAILSLEQNKGKIALFAGIDGFRFKKQVVPGDRLHLEVEITKSKGPVGKGNAIARVDDFVVASGELTFAVK